jgi:hypothetical protein
MSRASKGVERPRQQQGKEEDAAPAPLHLAAHPTLPLPLLSVAQSFRGMCVSAQLCDAQGAALFPFVRLPPRVRRPFARAPVHDMSLMHGERLRAVGCALTGPASLCTCCRWAQAATLSRTGTGALATS